MPELPEVEHVRSRLDAALNGASLDAVEVRRTDLRWPLPRARVERLEGHHLLALGRRGKYVLWHFDGGETLILHLGMSGRVLLTAARGVAWSAHEHWRLHFADCVVRYIDPRRFGALLACATPAVATHPLLARLGPDPLVDGLDPDLLFATTRGLRVSLKAWMLNATRICGIGNIYACEACFEAGIRPRRRVDRISRRGWARVAGAIVAVLRRALAAGGTTFRDYVDTAGEAGAFQRDLAVYGRAGQRCRTCGNAIKVVRHHGRSTYYCATCQV